MKQKKVILLLFAIIIAEMLFATGQAGDILIVQNDTAWIHSNPLEEYFKEKGNRSIHGIKMEATSTDLWRGYIATWKLENDSLFLVKIKTYVDEKPSSL